MTRLPIATVLCLGLLGLCGAAPVLADKAASWPLFRGNPLQNGVAASTLPEKLEILWKFETKDAIEATAAIADGTVYVGSLDGTLFALDLKTGKEKWRYQGGPFKTPVAVRNGLVFAGDLDGGFHCVEAATGKKRWTFPIEAEISSGANFAGDNILVGGGDEKLYCLSPEGKVVWQFEVPGGPVMGTPAVVDGRTFAAGCDSTLHVLEIDKGKELGAVDLEGQVGASVAVAGERLFVGTMSNQVLAIDWKKPEIAWKFQSAKRQQPFFASAAVTDDLVITGSRDKRVYALDRKTGREVWNFATEGRVDSSPVVVGSRVFVGSLDGNLYALDLHKGTLLEKWPLGDAISASPAVSDGCLVISAEVGTTRGAVVCLGSK